MKGKIDEFRKLEKREQRRLLKKFRQKHPKVPCLNETCTIVLNTYEGMMYHTQNCGNEVS